MAANCITVSRILYSLLLLGFSPNTIAFAVFYLLCGVTDVLDGFVARILHTESKTGEKLDSAADLFFAVTYAVKLLPRLDIPAWIWIWTAFIAGIKTFGILKISRNERGFCIRHSFGNKLTGVLIFLLPIHIHVLDIKYTAAAVCAAATVTAIEELLMPEGKAGQ